MARLFHLLSLLVVSFHVSDCVIRIEENMAQGTVVASYSCAGSASKKINGGLKPDLIKLNQKGSNVTLTLDRDVDLENKDDFPIVSNTSCEPKVKVDGYQLIFSCDGTTQTDPVVLIPADESKPYFCAKNCSKLERVTLTVPEKTTVGTKLLEFSICSGDVNRDFSSLSVQINPGTYLTEVNKKELKLRKLLDYENEPKTFHSSASLNGVQLLNIAITVTDSDDLGIKFSKQVYNCFIPENHPLTVTNCSVLAKDLDAGLNTPVGYELLSVTPDNNRLFEMLQNGSITLKNHLDREDVSVYYFAIKGYQLDRPVDKISHATVLLTVTDVDDNDPEMSKAFYNASVVENSPIGTTVCQVSASDKDEGENARFQYKIVGDNRYFEIDSSTGIIKVKATIDRETIGSNPVEFKVHAISIKPHGRQSNMSKVTVYILDENDNSPKFLQQSQSFTVSKTQAINTEIFRITANDSDDGRNGLVRYRIDSKDSPFHIDPNNGSVSLTRTLQESFDPFYPLVVIAEDNPLNAHDKRSSLLIVRINVSDVNIHIPTFVQNMPTKVNISEDAVVGTIVMELQAEDKDPTDTLRFLIDGANGVFTVDGNYLKTNTLLDREKTATYQVTIAVNDSVHVNRTHVTIQVTDINDNGPHFTKSHYVFNVTEEKVSPNFGQVTASDEDEGLNGHISYEIDIGSKWSTNFTVDMVSGGLSTKGALDREALSSDDSVTFLVFAYDRGQPERMNSTLVTVNILDINDNGPTFETREKTVHYRIKEGTHQATFHIAKAFDPDGKYFDHVRYLLKETALQSVIRVSDDGNVSLLKPLNFKDANGCNKTCITFTIEAYNRQPYSRNANGVAGRNSSQTVFLDIQAANYHKPVFAKPVYNKTIAECTKPGTEILRVSATDADSTTEFNTVFYWMELYNDTFSVAPDTGSIHLTGNIDYDPPANQTSIAFNVYATDDLKNLDRSISTKVTIDIGNCNDNPPVFSSGTYWCYINENHQGDFNCRPVATDADGDTLTYNISGSPAEELAIASSSGTITAVKPFDFDTMDSKELKLNVTATDNKHTSFATVIVKVLDWNDERPKFQEDYTFNIKEHVKDTSYFVGEMKVSDADSKFSLFVDDCKDICKGCFHINEKGDIMAVRAFDYEDDLPNSFTCVVSANDTSKDHIAKDVTINILDVNDNSPIFTKSSINSSVNETAAVGTFVAQVSATDRDRSPKFNTVSYSIYAGNELGLFSIDRANGSVSTTKKVADHFGENVTLMLKACDNGQPPLCDYSHLTVQINNLNIHAPVFVGAPYHVQFKEDTRNVSVLQVHAKDIDGDTLHYTVVNETSTFFFKNNVLYAKAPDAEKFQNTSGQCYVGIKVSDGIHQTLTTVFVTIIDENDNTPLLLAKTSKGYSVKINDTTRIGESIFSIRVRDLDISNKGFTYVVTGGKGDFEINQTNGKVFLANALGKNGKTYNMSIVVMDHGDPPKTDSSVLLLEIIDTFPAFHFKGDFVVNMNEENGTVQTSLAVADEKGNVNNLDYQIISVNKQNILDMFSLDHSSGLLTLASTSKPLNYELQSKYVFTILAKDHGVFPKTQLANVTINVIDINEKPTLTSFERVVIKEENSPANTFVAKVQADDPDINNPFNKLVFTLSDNSIFKVDEHGNITVKANNLKAGNYSLKVTVTDGGHLTDTVTLSVVVPSIKIISYNITLKENNTVPLGVWKLYTEFNGMTVNYNILQSTFSGIFMLTKTAELKLNAAIDREIIARLEVHLEGRDASSGVLLTRNTVVINVEDINDCTPYFPMSHYDLTIDDLVQNNDIIATIAAEDRDVDEVNRNLTYRLTGTEVAGLFSMSQMGNLKVLDSSRLRTKVYNILINVTDGKFQNKATLKINVVDTNDHSPGFNKSVYSFTIRETNSTGITVGSVHVHDADSGRNGNVSLSITAGNQNLAFKINSTSGLIQTVKPVDRETVGTYELIVTAKDDGKTPRQGTCTVIVDIEDLNDNNPKLQVSSKYSGSVLENSKRDIEVEVTPEITATDPDFGINGEAGLVYELNDTHSPFCIKRLASRASVYVCGDIDRESKDIFYLEVIVLDSNGSRGHRHSAAPLTIRILDENDEVPQFTESVYTFNVSENIARSMAIGKVSVTDNDLDGNKDIRFEIAKGDEGKFHIDTYTGIIYVGGSIDRERQSDYELFVMASDGVNQNFTQVIIHVLDVNDNPPIFTMFVVDVEENGTGVIFNASVHDKDEKFTKNSEVSFSVESLDSQGLKTSKFAINKDGGLYVTSPLDRETDDHYEVTITATDNGTPALSSSVHLYINVLDIDDNQPKICVDGKCGIAETEVHISENTPALSILKILGSRDPDAGSSGTVTFSVMKSTLSEYFSIDKNKGVVRVDDPQQVLHIIKAGSVNSKDWNVKFIATDGHGQKSNVLTMRVLVNP